MNKWNFEETTLKDAYLITAFCADDCRGSFIKDYSKEEFEKHSIRHDLKEVFYIVSHKGVLRGIHFQKVKQQAKLVRCISGCVYDVIIDLRKDSPTFMKWQGFILSGDNMKELLVPEGFGHGYLVLEDSIVSYKCAEKFYGEHDSGIKYDDPAMAIEWPYDKIGGKDNIILSDKDKDLQTFNDFILNYKETFNG